MNLKRKSSKKYSEILSNIRKIMKNECWDYYFHLGYDSHFCLPTCDTYRTVEYLTGFSGDASLLVTNNDAFVFTDSRFAIQAKEELDKSYKLILDDQYKCQEDITKFLITNYSSKGGTVVVDGRTHSIETVQEIEKSKFKIADFDLVNVVWQDRPIEDVPQFVSLENTGNEYGNFYRSRAEKITFLLDNALTKGPSSSDAILLTMPNEISFFFNLININKREDLGFSSYALLTSRIAYLFINKQSLSKKIEEELNTGFDYKGKKYRIVVLDYDEFYIQASKLLPPKSIIVANQSKINLKTARVFTKGQFYAQIPNSILINNYMNIRSDNEINSMNKVALVDSMSVVKAMYSIYQKWERGEEIFESDVVNEIENVRKKIKSYICPSFPTIVGFGASSAICHYVPKEQGNKLNKDDCILVDTGGQYLGGTTDTTRCWCFSNEIPENLKETYTTVLIAHLNLIDKVFPIGTNGLELDFLVRKDINAFGYTIPHGVGHSISQSGPVHSEIPRLSQRIEISTTLTPIVKGMVFSCEPGVYIENQYGVRIENMLCAKNLENLNNSICLMNLTNIPYFDALINKKRLSSEQYKSYEEIQKKILYSLYNEAVFNDEEISLTDEELNWVATIAGFPNYYKKNNLKLKKTKKEHMAKSTNIKQFKEVLKNEKI